MSGVIHHSYLAEGDIFDPRVLIHSSRSGSVFFLTYPLRRAVSSIPFQYPLSVIFNRSLSYDSNNNQNASNMNYYLHRSQLNITHDDTVEPLPQIDEICYCKKHSLNFYFPNIRKKPKGLGFLFIRCHEASPFQKDCSIIHCL